jgi:hypothetical protein
MRSSTKRIDLGKRPRSRNTLLPLYNLLDVGWEYSGAARYVGTFVVTWGRRGKER